MEGKELLDISYIKKQFLCCIPLDKFHLANSKTCCMDLDVQQNILNNTVRNAIVTKYPIRKSYQKGFLKLLINELEKNGQEIHDDVYTEYCKLISSDQTQTSTHYRHFSLSGKGTLNCITLEESTNIISQGTTGLCTWQAALGLSEWCVANEQIINGKTVLELGSGIGLTGITIISTIPLKRYTFSDCHPSVLKMLCKNIRINYSESTPVYTEADLPNTRLKLEMKHNDTRIAVLDVPWEDITEQTTNELGITPDVILAADVLYDRSLFPVLINGLKVLLANENSCAIIAATVRNVETVAEFLNELAKYNLTFVEDALPKSTIFIQSDDTPIRIIKIFNQD